MFSNTRRKAVILLVAASGLLALFPAWSPAQGGGLLSRLREQQKQQAGVETPAAEKSYVLLDLDGAYDEKGVSSGFGKAPGSLRDLVLELRDMAEDDEVDGVILRLHDVEAGLGKLSEIREGLEALAKAKPVHIFLTSMRIGGIYLATAGTQVSVPPEHDFLVNGVGADLVFLKRMFDKVGIRAEVARSGKFKSAMEMFTETEVTEATKESYGALIDTIFEEVVGSVALSRKLEFKAAESLLTKGLLTADEAKEGGLIDYIEGEPELYERIANDLGEEFTLVEDYGPEKDDPFSSNNPFEVFSKLMGDMQEKEVEENSIALVYLSGMIIDGGPEEAALEDEYISAYPIVQLLEEIRENEDIKAVILRIDSGGGSAMASDRIYGAVKRLVAEKPVVVSMSDVAASGGYYIAAPASLIMADKMTITGSIGVIGGKFVLEGLYDWVGLDFGVVSRGRDLDPFDTTRSWTEAERALIDKLIGNTYDTFLSRVSDGREMESKAVHEVAQGRIWSGRDALKIGLVDELGGLLASFRRAKELAGLDPDSKYPLAIYPKKLSFAEILERAFGGFGSNASLQTGGRKIPGSGAVAAAMGPAAAFLPKDVLAHLEGLFILFQHEQVALVAPDLVRVRLR